MYISLTIFLFRSGIAFYFHLFSTVQETKAKKNMCVYGHMSKEGRKIVYSRHKTASTNDCLPEISKMKYRNRIPEPGTTISGFANSKKKKKNLMPTDTRFF
jgi:hypothetical protein